MLTKQMVANYYDVDIRTVENCLSANEDELRYNGYFLCRGNSLKEFKLRFAPEIDFGSKTTHWNIGKLLHDKKLESKHGSGVVNRLSLDLKQMYPEMGVSPRNLWDMKKFYEHFKESDENCDTLSQFYHGGIL